MKNINDYVKVQAFTQNGKVDAFSSFDFNNIKIDQLTGKVSMANNDSDSDEDKMKNENIKYCYFRLKGTSYISKTSKTQWAQS